MESVVSQLNLDEDESVVTKGELHLKVEIRTGGMFGKKFLVGKADGEGIPAYMLLTDRRLAFISEYTTQSRLSIAIVVSVPTGRKHTHALLADFALRHYQGIRIGMLGGCQISFSAHGEMASQYPRLLRFPRILAD